MISDSALSRRRRRSYDPSSPSSRQEWIERNRRFVALWTKRTKNDVSISLTSYLNDASPHLRRRAVIALGRLEKPRAEASLRLLLKRPEGRPFQVDPRLVRFAVGRIRARNLHGRAKVNVISKIVGMSFADVALLSHRLATLKGYAAGQEFNSLVLVREFIYLLRDMKKQGDNVAPLLARMAVSPAHRLLIQLAKLPPRQQAEKILDYAMNLEIISPDDTDVGVSYLVNLGSEAHQVIAQRLQRVLASPQKQPVTEYGSQMGILLRAAGETRNRDLLPLIERFKTVFADNKWIVQSAWRAQDTLNNQEKFPDVP